MAKPSLPPNPFTSTPSAGPSTALNEGKKKAKKKRKSKAKKATSPTTAFQGGDDFKNY